MNDLDDVDNVDNVDDVHDIVDVDDVHDVDDVNDVDEMYVRRRKSRRSYYVDEFCSCSFGKSLRRSFGEKDVLPLRKCQF